MQGYTIVNITNGYVNYEKKSFEGTSKFGQTIEQHKEMHNNNEPIEGETV